MAAMRMAMVIAALIALAGCGGAPIDPASVGEADEIPPGPGLLTGEDGEFRKEF